MRSIVEEVEPFDDLRKFGVWILVEELYDFVVVEVLVSPTGIDPVWIILTKYFGSRFFAV